MSIHWPIIRTLLRNPFRVLIHDDRRQYRGIEILIAAMHVASHIQGKSQTDKLALLLPTSGAFPIAALAGWFLGKTVVPLNYLLRSQDLQHILTDCGADTVITVQPMLDFLGDTAEDCFSAPEGGRGVPTVKHLVRMEDIDFKAVPDVHWPRPAASGDLALLLYTSGTSGRPKGVMLTHGNITANISQIRRWVSFTPRDTLLGILPQFHSFGLTVLTLLPITVGCQVAYAARFVPAQIIRLLRKHRPTAFIAIPSMYNALLHVKEAAPDDFSSLRYIVSGGEPLPEAVAQGFIDRFKVRINEGYGLTETAPVTNWCRPQDYKPHSVGMPLPDVRERIVDIDSGQDLPHGKEGEVRIAGPNVMQGYYNLPDETRDAFDEHGYFRTGDMGRFDRDGHLYITGRLKEMLIVGGENVFPREIEEVLNKHDSVKASGVVGEQDPVRGELPVAFIELEEGASLDESALKAWCRKHLANYKVPRRIVPLDELPRNPTGKVLRRDLQARIKSESENGEAEKAAASAEDRAD